MPGLLDALKDPEFRRQVLQGLTDAGNRGLAAGLGGPVDLAELVVNAGLGLAGQKPISNSVGGSEWIGQQMQRIGSVSDVRNPSAEFLASLLMPGASVKGAKVIGKAVDNAQKPGTVARAGERGAIVYHGTPHKFDKFDSSKIGTGEGAQVYGHGLYFAERPAVAQEYADALGKEVLIKGKPAYRAKDKTSAADLPISNAAAGQLRMNDWDLNKAIESAKDDFIETGDQWFAKVHDELSTLSPEDVVINRGELYSVDLPDDQIAKMLDWDKPLSQQSKEVQAAIAKTKAMLPPNAIDDLGGDLSLMYGPDVMPQDFLNTWESLGQTNGAEMALKQLGIPGVRYLDGGSRGAGTGTRNYVVFPGNEDMLKILERNGKPLK